MTVDRTVIDRFLSRNPQVSRELLVTAHGPDHRLHHAASVRRWVGWYRHGEITIFPDLCTRPGAGYSWPGHISDRTVMGVLAHELGHHVHMTRPDAQRIRETFPRRRRVTGYEPNVDESFAETFRLFLLNPSLLQEGREERHRFLTETLGLCPVEDRHWSEVLAAAPQRMRARIPAWMDVGR